MNRNALDPNRDYLTKKSEATFADKWQNFLGLVEKTSSESIAPTDGAFEEKCFPEVVYLLQQLASFCTLGSLYVTDSGRSPR
jgi:hypothetical protein